MDSASTGKISRYTQLETHNNNNVVWNWKFVIMSYYSRDRFVSLVTRSRSSRDWFYSPLISRTQESKLKRNSLFKPIMICKIAFNTIGLNSENLQSNRMRVTRRSNNRSIESDNTIERSLLLLWSDSCLVRGID